MGDTGDIDEHSDAVDIGDINDAGDTGNVHNASDPGNIHEVGIIADTVVYTADDIANSGNSIDFTTVYFIYNALGEIPRSARNNTVGDIGVVHHTMPTITSDCVSKNIVIDAPDFHNAGKETVNLNKFILEMIITMLIIRTILQ